MTNDETRKPTPTIPASTSSALAGARAALQTARMSIVELEKLRESTRGPSPDSAVISALLGREYDATDVQAVLFPLSLRHRTMMGGHSEAANKGVGLRVILDGKRRIEGMTLYGPDNSVGATAWTGTLPSSLSSSLSTSSKASDVRRQLGRLQPAVVDGIGEEQVVRGTTVYGFVFVDDAIAEVRLRRSP